MANLESYMVYGLQDVVTPLRNGITTFEITNPIKHEANTDLGIGLKLRTAELLTNLLQG
jgi:hypothetical protein